MTNEISVTIRLGCTNGEFNLQTLGTPHSIDQNEQGGGYPGHLVIDTTETTIDLSSFVKPGYAYLKNIGVQGSESQDPILSFGPDGAGTGTGGGMIAFGDLKVGEEACFRLTDSSPTLILKSSLDSTLVQLVILED